MNVSTVRLASWTLLVCISSEIGAKTGEERWIAYSRTAIAITGDIILSSTRLRTSGNDFPLKLAADVPNYESDLDGSVQARVLAVTRKMDPKLRNGNRLGCGHSQPIRWIVVWRSQHGKALGMDTFSAGHMPKSVKDPGFCGSYSYFRK